MNDYRFSRPVLTPAPLNMTRRRFVQGVTTTLATAATLHYASTAADPAIRSVLTGNDFNLEVSSCR